MRGKIVLVLCLVGLLITSSIAASNDKKIENDKAVDNKTVDVQGAGNIDNNTLDDKDDNETEIDSMEINAKAQNNGIGAFVQSAISVEALSGPALTDLIVHVPSNVTLARRVQVKAYYTNGTLKFTRTFSDQPVANSIILVQFGDLLRGERVDVRVQTDQYGWLGSSTVVLLRPDLVIYSAIAAGQVLVGDSLPVNITVREINGDMGANATVALMNNAVLLDAKKVNVSSGGMTNVVLSTVFTSRGKYNLSVNITNAVPAEYNETNNTYSLAVRSVAPDLAVSSISAPAKIDVGQVFEIRANISEVNGEVGANVTVALIENNTMLDNRMIYVPAAGFYIVSFNTSLNIAGNHSMTVRIIDSVPADTFSGNNELSFGVYVMNPLEPVSFVTTYNYQNVSLNTSHYINSSGNVDNSEELEIKEDEVLSFKASSSRILSFPIKRIYLNITSEAGEGIVYEETMVNPTDSGKSTFTKYYPASNAVLNFSIDANGTYLSLESKSNSTIKQSKGYLYWWFKPAQEWNVTTSSGIGKLLRAKSNLRVRVEMENGVSYLGGNADTVIGNRSYVGGWTDSTEGYFEQRRAVWLYAGSSSGITVP